LYLCIVIKQQQFLTPFFMTQLTVLSAQEIASKAPQAYATQAADTVSKHYQFLPTSRVIEDMAQLGWFVTDAHSMKTTGKNPARGVHAPHQVQFYNPDVYITNEDGTDISFVKVLLRNNSMGQGRLLFSVGIFRMICSNGLVIKDKDMGEFKLRHMGYNFEHLQGLMSDILDRLPSAVEKINTFTNTQLTDEQAVEFAGKALASRLKVETVTLADAVKCLEVYREEDRGLSLWKVFNRVQEALVNGGQTFTNAHGRQRKLRKTTNFLLDQQINEQMWELASEYAN